MITSLAAPNEIDANAFTFISDLVKKRSAIVLETKKSYLVESRLSPIVHAHGFTSFDSLVTELKKPNASQLVQEVVEAMTTNETSFFRDLHPFNALKTKVLPDLIERNRKSQKIMIWSNACSSGQEAYSIAMLLREYFKELDRWDVKIVATDICTKVLNKAESGEFNQTEVKRGLPEPLQLKYFNRDKMKWILKDEIRNMVTFRPLNLIEPWPSMPPIDIVFLRNVLIYFEVETKRAILAKVHHTLRDGGYLFLGGAETTLGLNSDFRREQVGLATCYLKST